MIDRIDHLVLTVADLEATLSFYERVLGMRRHVAEGRPAALLFGCQKINVHQADHLFDLHAAHSTRGAGDFCLIATVPLAEARARIEAAGVAIELGPVDRTGAEGPMRSIYLRDPDGNLVEVSEYGR